MSLISTGPGRYVLMDAGIMLGEITGNGRLWWISKIQHGVVKPTGDWPSPTDAAQAISDAVDAHVYRAVPGFDGLTELQHAILDFEETWWAADGDAHAVAFRTEFPNVGDVSYRQQIRVLVDSQAAALRSPAVVALLKRRLAGARRLHQVPRPPMAAPAPVSV